MTEGADTLPRGTWVPETNGNRWEERAREVGLTDLPWRQRYGVHDRPDMISPVEDDHEKYMRVLGADMSSAERDGLVYFNMMERLKNSPSDAVADEVVGHMRSLGFASVEWPHDMGGPPPHHSPISWRPALDWLMKKLAQVGRFLLNCVENAMTILRQYGALTLSVDFGLPPSVSIAFEADLFSPPNQHRWEKIKVFLESKLDELENHTF